MSSDAWDWVGERIWDSITRYSVNDRVSPTTLIDRIDVGAIEEPDVDHLSEPHRYLDLVSDYLSGDNRISYEAYFNDVGDLDRFLMAVPGEEGIYLQHRGGDQYRHAAVKHNETETPEESDFIAGITDLELPGRFNRFDYQSIDFALGSRTDKKAFFSDFSEALREEAPSPEFLTYREEYFDTVQQLDNPARTKLVQYVRDPDSGPSNE